LACRPQVYTTPASSACCSSAFPPGCPCCCAGHAFVLAVRGRHRARDDRAFELGGLAYGFKFLWSPLVDRLPLPFLTAWLGKRRAWLLLSQICIAAALLGMANTTRC